MFFWVVLYNIFINGREIPNNRATSVNNIPNSFTNRSATSEEAYRFEQLT